MAALTLTRSRNLDDIETLLLAVWGFLGVSIGVLCVPWLGLHGPVGDGREPTSILMLAIYTWALLSCYYFVKVVCHFLDGCSELVAVWCRVFMCGCGASMAHG